MPYRVWYDAGICIEVTMTTRQGTGNTDNIFLYSTAMALITGKFPVFKLFL